MWILFRLVLAIAAFAARQFGTFGRLRGVPTVVGDQTVLIAEKKHKGSVVGYFAGVELKAPIWFRLHPETAADRWFKRLGFSTETETRDRAFDEFVYVVCDHPMFAALLKRSAEARRLISALLTLGISRIEYSGEVVWCSMKTEPSPEELSLVAQLGKALAPLGKDSSGRFSDPFVWKALFVEGVVWSLAAYGWGAFVEVIFRREDIHLSGAALLMPGLVMAAVLFALLIGGVRFFMGGSSRGHRIIIESAALLILGLPPTGMQLVADLNRGLDSSSVEIRTRVSSCEKRVTTNYRRGRRRTSTSYHLRVSGSAEGITLPSDIRVASSVCLAATAGAPATITLGRGAFGYPWYRGISVGGATWAP